MGIAKKHLGQHFLHDPRILRRIAEAVQCGPGDSVLEIGPGRGALTAELLARGARVSAIEKDPDLLPRLVAQFPDLRLASGDALALDWRAVSAVGTGPLIIAGNIPYNITSPLIEKALTPPRPVRVVFLVQKEVADRLAARPGSKAYGGLTVGVQAVARVERLMTVVAGAFVPAPKVDSAVVRLTPREVPLVSDREAAPFRRLVTGLFGARRKQLGRGVRQVTGWGADRTSAVLGAAGFDPTVRPEMLAPEEFVALHRLLVDERDAPG